MVSFYLKSPVGFVFTTSRKLVVLPFSASRDALPIANHLGDRLRRQAQAKAHMAALEAVGVRTRQSYLAELYQPFRVSSELFSLQNIVASQSSTPALVEAQAAAWKRILHRDLLTILAPELDLFTKQRLLKQLFPSVYMFAVFSPEICALLGAELTNALERGLPQEGTDLNLVSAYSLKYLQSLSRLYQHSVS